MGLNEIQQNNKKGQPLPLGASIEKDGINFAVELYQNRKISLILYKKGENKIDKEIEFPKENRQGRIAYLFVSGILPEEYEYNFRYDGYIIQDPYAKRIVGREEWGKINRDGLKCGFLTEKFQWGNDTPPNIAYEDSIIYRLHTRGFTKHTSSGVTAKGTYEGIIEKIPYFKELGITMVELMPIHEFDEILIPNYPMYSQENDKQKKTLVNYWGYTRGFYFTPKASYAYSKNPCIELKHLVKELHRHGIEIGVEFYFAPGTKEYLILDCLKYWAMEYHLDAIHVNADVAPMTLIGVEPLLSNIKLFGNHWNTEQIYARGEFPEKRSLGEFNDGFMVDIRRFLKADEDQINSFIYRMSRNPEKIGVINYISNHNSLTLKDMVSYEKKHNEANGEMNRDGTSYNYSWNCGVEGPTRKKKVLERREQQMKNAMLMLMLSQGTPMLLSGDELGHSKKGNNNAYCQDNEISWINWKLTKKEEEWHQFVKDLIQFRKAHRIFHMPQQLKMMDYGTIGFPDMSYHGTRAWYPELDNYSRHIGIMLCGIYAGRCQKDQDNYFYLAFNSHWEKHDFALPNLPKGKKWYLVYNTHCSAVQTYSVGMKEPLLSNQKCLQVLPRSIIVLIGK